MASLVATSRSVLSPRYALPFLRPNWSLPCEPSTSSSVLQSTRVQNTFERLTTYEASLDRPIAPWYLSIPSISSLVELFPPILLAVPKHKVTHSRKSMRSANKGLKNKTNFSQCEACGSIKLAHNICPTCYSQISRKWKREARGDDVPLGAVQRTEASA